MDAQSTSPQVSNASQPIEVFLMSSGLAMVGMALGLES